jgi:hypothetical protein
MLHVFAAYILIGLDYLADSRAVLLQGDSRPYASLYVSDVFGLKIGPRVVTTNQADFVQVPSVEMHDCCHSVRASRVDAESARPKTLIRLSWRTTCQISLLLPSYH